MDSKDSALKSDTIYTVAPALDEKRRAQLLWDEYRRFHESAPMGYFTLDSAGTILNANITGARLLGSTPAELMGKKLSDFLTGYCCADYEDLIKSVQETELWQQRELEIVRSNGSRLFALVQARRIAAAGELVVFATDITERSLAEQALRESEQKYREVAERLAEGVFEADTTGKVTYANKKALSSFGLFESDIENGLMVFDVVAPESLELAKTRMAQVLKRVDAGASEYVLQRRDRTTFPALVHSLAVIHDGKVVGVRGIFVDISERKRTEMALQESERRYRELAELLGAGVFEADTKGNLVYGNRKGLAYYGLDENDVKNGFNIFNVIIPAELKVAGENFARVLNQEDIGPIEYTMLKRDGTTFSGLTHVTAIVRDGAVVGVRGVVVDVSERRRTEDALRESERKYRELADQLDEGVYEIDPSGNITYANRKGLAYLGITDEEIETGVCGFDLIVNDDQDKVRERYGRTLKGEDLGAVEYVFKRKDGKTFPALTHSSAIFRDGVVVGVRGVIIDISDLKRAENALKESEQKYRELTDLLDEAVFELDLEGRFTYSNRKGLSSLGFNSDDLKKGLTVFQVVSPPDVDIAKASLARAITDGDTGAVEFNMIRKDGTTFPAVTHGSAITRNGAVVGIRGIVFDISDLKRAEQALKDSEERISTLLKSLHEGIWALDKDDITTFVNPRMAEMLGYTEEEMLGRTVYSFNDDQWKKFTEGQMQRRKQGIPEQVEGELVGKDGRRVYALFETSPILDKDGNYVGSIAGVQDITARKIGEERLQRTMAELDRSNKELEQFAYVTSHDLREPLRMMTSFSQSLEKRYKDRLDSTANEYIHFIVDGASRMQKLIDDILVYSRVTTRAQPFAAVDMEKVFEDALFNIQGAMEEAKAEITHDPLPIVQADASQMRQVMQNLIGNAVKFSREGVSPQVHVSARSEAGAWLFSVHDNGIGIDPELFGRLFNLFQRLHPPDKYPGTGVGLAVTKKIVERHGGRIWVESKPGQGSTFLFTIPERG